MIALTVYVTHYLQTVHPELLFIETLTSLSNSVCYLLRSNHPPKACNKRTMMPNLIQPTTSLVACDGDTIRIVPQSDSAVVGKFGPVSTSVEQYSWLV